MLQSRRHHLAKFCTGLAQKALILHQNLPPQCTGQWWLLVSVTAWPLSTISEESSEQRKAVRGASQKYHQSSPLALSSVSFAPYTFCMEKGSGEQRALRMPAEDREKGGSCGHMQPPKKDEIRGVNTLPSWILPRSLIKDTCCS